ncbi:MAG: hypothetical protein M3Z04_08155 [Chloroflexota bacterium]|nr:hypothetical protein [Chloroflexota bacterium]
MTAGAEPGVPRWAWAAMPLLAVIAWLPVLSLWFISDDFALLLANTRQPWPQPFLLGGAGSLFYRPLSTSLTWNLGSALFGTQALPYHAVSLGLHALTAWLLGRAVAVIIADGRVGWLAGLVFAVWPLATEPVAWLAAQWDLWAAVCALAAVWAFAAWQRQGGRRLYSAGLLAYAAALLMKETVLPLPALLAAVAWFMAAAPTVPTESWPARLRRLGGSVLPFAALTLGFVLFRIALSGRVGGYTDARTDLQNFWWPSLISAGRQILDPLNRSAVPLPLVQALGWIVGGALALGLLRWGWACRRVLALATVWFAVFLVPVLNLIAPDNPTSNGSRFLYWSLMGGCLAAAGLIGTALGTRHWRRWGMAGALGGALLCVPLTWLQLQPWQQTSRQTQHLSGDLAALIQPLPGRRMQVNVADLPHRYQGSYVFLNGLAEAITVFAGQPARLVEVPQLDPAALDEPLAPGKQAGIYNLGLAFDPATQLYTVRELTGITVGAPPPATGSLWDYRACGPATARAWQPQGAQWACRADDDGADLPPGGTAFVRLTLPGGTAQLTSPSFALDRAAMRWVRLAVCLRGSAAGPPHPGAWLWDTPAGPMRRPLALDSSGAWRVYWTTVSAATLPTTPQSLRLALPAQAGTLDLAWIAITPIR